MRFYPIEHYRTGLLDRSQGIENLVSDFGVRSWARMPSSLQEALRCLRDGRAYWRQREAGIWCYPFPGYLHAIDHAMLFRCDSGVFIVTMPYATPDLFHEAFDRLMLEHNTMVKNSLIVRDDVIEDVMAKVVSSRYKVAENGDIVAFIATKATMNALDKLMEEDK